jgi:hypothetical protein
MPGCPRESSKNQQTGHDWSHQARLNSTSRLFDNQGRIGMHCKTDKPVPVIVVVVKASLLPYIFSGLKTQLMERL